MFEQELDDFQVATSDRVEQRRQSTVVGGIQVRAGKEVALNILEVTLFYSFVYRVMAVMKARDGNLRMRLSHDYVDNVAVAPADAS